MESEELSARERAEIRNAELIAKYQETGDIEYRNLLVLACMDIVKYVSAAFRAAYNKFGDANDVVNEGVIALINAIESYSPDKNTKFETYANLKIKGAIIDYIRRQDFIPRRIRKFGKDLDDAYTELYKRLGRRPTNEELAGKLEITVPLLLKQMSDTAGAMTVSFEEMLYEDNVDNSDVSVRNDASDHVLYKKEQTLVIAQAIEKLKPREQKVISMYYYDRLKFAEIADILGVTESRICQIHSKCMLFLKRQLEDYIRG